MPAWVLPAALAVGGALVNMAQNWRARKVNENYVRQQNDYNSPKSQMARFQTAGLNPNLVYQQGNPGNQSTTLSQPDMQGGTQAVDTFNKSRMADTQQAVGRARVEQSKAMAQVNRLQADVLSKNPLLNDAGFEAVINSLKATAIEKSANAAIANQKSEWSTGKKTFRTTMPDGTVVERTGPAGVQVLEKELDLLDQRFNLGQADQAIKAEVLNSKEFENAILEIQKNFITDGDIGPAQILEFVKMLLLKVKPR